MELGMLFYVVCGLLGVAAIFNLIEAARICRVILQRSGDGQGQDGLPGLTRIIPVALNRGVAQDDDTQDLRAQMNRRLYIILGGFFVFYLYLRIVGIA